MAVCLPIGAGRSSKAYPAAAVLITLITRQLLPIANLMMLKTVLLSMKDASGLNLTFSHTYNNNVFDNLDLGEEFYQGYGNQVGSNTASTFTNNVLTNIKANGLSLSGALPTNEIESFIGLKIIFLMSIMPVFIIRRPPG